MFVEPPNVFALRVTGASQKFAKPSLLLNHRAATLVTKHRAKFWRTLLIKHNVVLGVVVEIAGEIAGIILCCFLCCFFLAFLAAFPVVARTGQKFAIAPELDDQRPLVAAGAGDTGWHLFLFDVAHLVAGLLQRLLKGFVEFAHQRHPLLLPRGDIVELLLQVGGERIIYDGGKVFNKQVGDNPPQGRRDEFLFAQFDILAFLDG